MQPLSFRYNDCMHFFTPQMCHIPGLSHSPWLITLTIFYFIFVAQQQHSSLGRLIIEVSRSHSGTTHTPDDGQARRRETFTWQHKAFARERQPRTPQDSNSQCQEVRERPKTHALTIAGDSKIMKLLTMQFSPALCYFHIVPLTPETKFHIHTKQQANS